MPSIFVARPDKYLRLGATRKVNVPRERSRIRTELCGGNDRKMPLVPRNVFPATAPGSSKEHSLPNGKENKVPFSIATATVKKCKKFPLRRRVSLSSNDDQRTESAGSTGQQRHAIAETYSSRKTPFHVHCDDKNAPEPKPQPQVRPRRGSTATLRSPAPSRDHRNEHKQSPPGFKETGGRSRRPLPDDRSRRNNNPLPSKIPRRARSISTGSNQRKHQSRENENVLSRQAIAMAPSTSSKAVERTMAARRGITNRTYRQELQERVVTPATVRGDWFERRIVDSIELLARLNGYRSNVSPSTPASVHTPKTYVFNRPETPKQPVRIRASKPRPTLCAGKLICNAEYHEDLSIVELEKEERALQLSANFLEQHVNAEQRTVIVMFFLHLGVNCRFPSYIIYQAVKLFDLAIDRLPVDTKLIQLTALASLWIALKTLEYIHKIPTASTMVRLAKDLYAGREDLLIDYERKILRALDFNITFADVHSLLAYHLINCKRCVDLSEEMFQYVYHASGYAIDVTLLDGSFCRTSASMLAVTVVELVLGLVVDTDQARATDRCGPDLVRPRWLFWRGLLYAADKAVGSRFGDRFQDGEYDIGIDRCRVTMLRCILNSGKKKSRFEVVWKKYSRSRFGRISESFLERARMLSPFETFDP